MPAEHGEIVSRLDQVLQVLGHQHTLLHQLLGQPQDQLTAAVNGLANVLRERSSAGELQPLIHQHLHQLLERQDQQGKVIACLAKDVAAIREDASAEDKAILARLLKRQAGIVKKLEALDAATPKT